MNPENQNEQIEITIDNEPQKPALKNNKPGKKTFKQRIAAADAWLKEHPKKSIAMLVVGLLIIGGGVLWALTGGNFSSIVTPAKATPSKFYSKLTGREVSEKDSKRPVTAVMIENSPEARPQSGLAEADTVFESVAEGGITRFLVLYQEDKPSLIGPVRSVRPQFASLAAAYDAGLAHVGGSDIPLRKLRSGKIRDLDQFFNAGAYWRASDRYAPHNMYTSTAKLDALNKAKKYTSSDFTPWQHASKSRSAKKANAKTINVPVSSGLFDVNYVWVKSKNSYVRYEGGALHKDREKGNITPKVVIAMQVPHDVIRDSNGYSYPNVNSHGKAWIFQNGTVQQVRWSKKNDKSMINFTLNGKKVKLNRGKAWITLIKPSTKPTWK